MVRVTKWFGLYPIFVLGLCSLYIAENSWPEERGLIITTYRKYYYYYWDYVENIQLRHLPVYPGYENVTDDSSTGIAFEENRLNFESVDVDFRRKCVYIYDSYLNTIVIATNYSKDLDPEETTMYTVNVGVSQGQVQVAVDWLSHTLYWSDSSFRWIMAVSGDIDRIDKHYYRIIADTHLEYPDGIALDPLSGYLFWTDNGYQPKIERSDMNGRGRHTIIGRYLKSPLTLEADIFQKRLYWIETDTDSILSATYDGTDLTTVHRLSDTNLHDLAIFRDLLYISDNKNAKIYTLNTTKGEDMGKEEAEPVNFQTENIHGLAVYGEETQPVKDKDYCADLNCEHLCISTSDGAECVCSDGYDLSEDGLCRESDVAFNKAVVVANQTHVCLLDIRAIVLVNRAFLCTFSTTSQDNTTYNNGSLASDDGPTESPNEASSFGNILLFDLDMERRILFLATDQGNLYQRPIDLPIDNGAAEFIVAATGSISGLAYDSGDTNNLYWCESDTGSVRVVNVETHASRKLVATRDLTNPKDIIVIRNHRKLALLSGGKRYSYIRAFDMDGSDADIIVRSKREIDTFTYDEEHDVFFYISGRYVYEVDVDGNREYSLYTSETGAYSLIQYQLNLAWVYEDNDALYVKVVDLDEWTVVRNEIFSNVSSDLVAMKVLDVNQGSINKTSPCIYDNGGCDQMCITKYTNGTMTLVCECGLGYQLANDNATCITTETVDDNFLLAADSTNMELVQISLETGAISAIPNVYVYKALYYDVDEKKVVWTELYDSTLYSADLNGSDVEILTVLGWYGYSSSFDKDLTTGHLYFTSHRSSSISVVTQKGDHIVLNDMYWGRGYDDIILHPGKGWLYFTSHHYSSSYIGRADMDGQDSVELITGDHVYDPQGLAIDFIHDHLYWSDASFDTIQRCDLNGKACVTIVNMTGTGKVEEIRDIVTDGEVLYYSAYRKDHIVRVNLTAPYEKTVIGQNPEIGKISTLILYSSNNKNIQPQSESCRRRNGRGDCSTYCFPTPRGRTCGCEDGIELKSDERSCSNVHQCNGIIEQTLALDIGREDADVAGDQPNVIEITFARSCLRYTNETCHYICPHNFYPNFDTLLTCTDFGWNLESKNLCREVKCQSTIPNGLIDRKCKHEVGNVCDFACKEGFVKAVDFLICSDNGTYQTPANQLCTPHYCSSEIENGRIENSCTRKYGASCDYTCNTYFSKLTDDINLTCHKDGWSPNPVGLCKESVCSDSSLNYGKIVGECERKIGSTCNIRCNPGYVNTTALVMCNSNLIWYPRDSCSRITCPAVVPNGNIALPCTFTVGSICAFKCTDGFKASQLHENVTCGATGRWNINPCGEVTCQGEVANGKLSTECKREIGESCEFDCNAGFEPSSTNVVCTQNGTFHPRVGDLCKPFKCRDTIDNGELVDGCQRTVGSSCKYKCNNYFTANVGNMEATCHVGGWNPPSSELCKEVLCQDDALTDGHIIGSCTRRVGEACLFRCNEGFVNATHEIVCQNDHLWHPRNICKAYTCSDIIANGQISPDCSRTIGSSCRYKCNEHYSPKVQDMNVTCLANGWSSTDLCEETLCDEGKLPHTRVTGDCSKKVGAACAIRCDPGYVNFTDVAVCRSDYTWHPGKPCDVIKCQPTISNGHITDTCDLTVGSSCKYKCNDGFVMKNGQQRITCASNGQWNIPSDLCLESVCEDTSLTNGLVIGDCDRKVGESCAFRCDDGFLNTTDLVVCSKDYTWLPVTACTEIKCSHYIANGDFSGTCNYRVGESCAYKCNEGFAASTKQATITCNPDGRWDTQESPCNLDGTVKPSTCDDTTLTHGKVTDKCSKLVGVTCKYQCNDGYKNTTLLVFCRNDKTWHPKDACSNSVADIKCKPYIANGRISEECSFEVGKMCNYTCNDGFVPTNQQTAITCNTDGHWDFGYSVCLAVSAISQASKNVPNDDGGLPIPGVAAGLSVLVLLVLVLTIVIVIVAKRNGILTGKKTIHDTRQVAFENPGFIQNNVSLNMDSSVLQTTTSDEMHTVFAEEVSVNNSEPLAAIDHIDVTNDRVVLTKDSWIKEQRGLESSADC